MKNTLPLSLGIFAIFSAYYIYYAVEFTNNYLSVLLRAFGAAN